MPDALDAIAEQVFAPEAPALPPAIVLAPSTFIFTGEDALRLTVHNSKTGVVIAVAYRQHAPNGDIPATTETFTPSADRQASSTEFVIGRGALLNVTVYASSGSPARGQTFVNLQVIRGRGTAATVLGTIVQGYVTGKQDRAWPGSLLETSIEGVPYARAVVGTDPAAGVSIVETVPAGARWRVRAGRAALTTNATVATRRPYLALTPAGAGGIASFQAGTQAQASGGSWAWALGLPLQVTITGIAFETVGLPDVVIGAGSTITIDALNVQPGDDWSAPTLFVDEWLEAQ